MDAHIDDRAYGGRGEDVSEVREPIPAERADDPGGEPGLQAAEPARSELAPHVGDAPRCHQPMETISTLSWAPVGVSYSTVSPILAPTRAVPRADPGDITSTPSTRSSMEPRR